MYHISASLTWKHLAFQIYLDGKEIGIIRNGKSYITELQAGHHTIFVKDENGKNLSQPLSFDIAPGEKVTLLCQWKAGWGSEILLWKQ